MAQDLPREGDAARREQSCRAIAAELQIRPEQAAAVAGLLEEGATIPFIARYRKERTGGLDEVAIAAVRDRLTRFEELNARRTAILGSLEERQLLTPALAKAVADAETLSVLEDLYLPYRPKRRTRATIAREKGLEPLAEILYQEASAEHPPRAGIDPARTAAPFVKPEAGVENVEAALAGARDIIAERISEDAATRSDLRRLFATAGQIESRVAKGKEGEGAKFRDWFDWRESVARVPSHRLLAMLRGEAEGVLKVSIAPPEERALELLRRRHLRRAGPAAREIDVALVDGYSRLLAPSLENEIRAEAKARADEEAIRVFAQNLRELLMASPLGRKAILAVDPGIRTGCKVVCLDPQGKLLHHTVLYLQGDRAMAEVARILPDLCRRFSIEAIAVGNGTGGREAESFIRSLSLPSGVAVVMVNESGASVYSASDVAREEFPAHDVTVRGAVSIGRRLMDPLAELVKIDPKAIGVGQYQHDVDQNRLRQSLDDVVSTCVNRVGVEVNTASRELLTYVAGLGPQLARNIVAWRDEHGPFRTRRQLREVPRLGPKAFEQAAGFLRIRDGEDPLDGSAVHPERYQLVARMAADLGCSVAALMADESLRRKIDLQRYVSESVGRPTLEDIMLELARPGRDPRDPFEVFRFAEGVTTIDDLQPGQRLPGIVTNVTRFGAFVDLGVHQDGLVHVSELADRFVADPTEVVKVGQKVEVTVLGVDRDRKRISLSLKTSSALALPNPPVERNPRSSCEKSRPVANKGR